MGLAGLATKEGTTRYIERFPTLLENSCYRRLRRMRLSSVGIGTYLGEAASADDHLYSESLTTALSHGINVIDTAINYRHMRSERVVGQVLAQLVQQSVIRRDEVFVCSKGGFLAFDADSGKPAEDYLRQTYLDSGLVPQAELEGLSAPHSLRPEFIKAQIEKSLQNLGLNSIDLYYLHNPEVQLARLSRTEFYSALTAAFAVLESAVKEGKIGCYGLSSWNGFRVESDHKEYLSFSEVLKCATAAGGANHNFAAIELPLNLGKTEAIAVANQSSPGAATKQVTISAACSEARIALFSASALGQGSLTRFLRMNVKEHFRNISSDTHLAVQFARSCPAVCSALVGMRQQTHVHDILGLLRVPPESPENFVRFFAISDKNLRR